MVTIPQSLDLVNRTDKLFTVPLLDSPYMYEQPGSARHSRVAHVSSVSVWTQNGVIEPYFRNPRGMFFASTPLLEMSNVAG